MKSFELLHETFLAESKPLLVAEIEHQLDVFRETEMPGASFDIANFNPTDNNNCFFGQGFHGNHGMLTSIGVISDERMVKLRKRLGTVFNPVWGKCCLLEVWAGDHFTEYRDMVTDAFRYATRAVEQRPDIEIHLHPYVYHPASMENSARMKELKEYAERGVIAGMGIDLGDYERLKKRKKKEQLDAEGESDDD